jgi:hypothetical protein
MKGVYSDRHMDSSITSGSQRVTRCGSGAKMRAAETVELPEGEEGRAIVKFNCVLILNDDKFVDWAAEQAKDSPGDVRARARVMLARLDGKA